jgi:septin family protein
VERSVRVWSDDSPKAAAEATGKAKVLRRAGRYRGIYREQCMSVLSIDGTALSGVTGYTMQVQNQPSAESGDGTASGGDTVSISDEAKSLSAAALKGQETDDSSSSSDSEEMNKKIQERIKEVQQEIEKVQNDPSLSEEQKKAKLAALQSELMTLQSELLEAQSKAGGNSNPGGTRAEGFASSLT